MKYIAKKEELGRIKDIYKAKKFIDEIGFTKPYLSIVFSGKKKIPKYSAYAIVKCIDKNAEILDYFEEEK